MPKVGNKMFGYDAAGKKAAASYPNILFPTLGITHLLCYTYGNLAYLTSTY